MSDELSRKKKEIENTDHVDALEHFIHRKKPLTEDEEHDEGHLKKNTFSVEKDWSTLRKKEYQEVDQSQPSVEDYKKKSSIFKKFFIFAISFFSIAVIVVLITSFFGDNNISTENVDISIKGNNFVEGGEELILDIEVSNKNTIDLELADLIVFYHKGGGESDDDKVTQRISLGEVPAGQSLSEEIRIVLFGERESDKDITVELEFRIKGSNAIFVKETTYPVRIKSAPIDLAIVGTESIGPNQQISFDIEITSASEGVLRNVGVQAIYPPGFQFITASPLPRTENNFWELSSLKPFEKKVITIEGTVGGQEGESRFIKVKVGESQSRAQGIVSVAYNTIVHEISILRPFLEVDFMVNGQRGKEIIANGGRPLIGTINWINNLDVSLEDIELSIRFSGNAFNNKDIQPRQGFYSNTEQRIVWDRSSVNQFISIKPKGIGSVDFEFTPLIFSNSNSSIISPEILIELSMRGRLSGETEIEEIKNFKQTVILFNTDTRLLAKGQYFGGPIENSGPVPPEPGEPTTYTIAYDIANSSNPISEVAIKTILPTNVVFKGATVPSYESVTYNESSREVMWFIDGIKAGVGSGQDPYSVAFQVEVTPSINDVGITIPLTREIIMTFIDTKTEEKITITKDEITTDLRNDPGYPGGEVQESQ
ncbi:MAG: hypothetical protein ACI9AR_000052 [Flavobacteriaceae bacterium]|jgi:hypothetical protein